MDKENVKTLSLICPSCGGKMKLTEDGEKAECPYCGHVMLIEKNDPGRKEYERRMAEARAEEDIKDLQVKRQRRRKLMGWIIAIGVIAASFLLCMLIPDTPMHSLISPQTVDPFEIVNLKITGMSGEGAAELQFSDSNAEYADPHRFQVTPQSGLSNGDTVKVTAKAPAGWRFEPSEKVFTVGGLASWVLHTGELEGDNLEAIHANTERLIREDWDEIVSSSFAREMTMTPYRMYLFISDDENEYERNVLYDTYEVKVTREDGTVVTTYEACRYASLKIPADGVLTADYGSLMGFNFGYTQGFSYSHSFSGWTDAAEMEADLRHARDGYHLAD